MTRVELTRSSSMTVSDHKDIHRKYIFFGAEMSDHESISSCMTPLCQPKKK